MRLVAIALTRRALDAAIPSWESARPLGPCVHTSRCDARSRSLTIPSSSADVESRVDVRLLSLVVREAEQAPGALAWPQRRTPPTQRHAGVQTVPQRRANAVVWTPVATALLLVPSTSD